MRYLLRTVYVVVATTILLEIVLQLGALTMWCTAEAVGPTESREPGQRAVLCVGDSWTQGIGASDRQRFSYPSALQGSLGDDWCVINRGMSGRNSRELLELLPNQLETFRPEQVVVLIGQNDFWSVPERLEIDLEAIDYVPESFRWRFRLHRLAQWLGGKFSGQGQSNATTDEASPSTNRIDASDPAWAPRQIPRRKFDYEFPPTSWARNKQLAPMRKEAWGLAGRQDFDGALALFEQALQLEPDDPDSLSATISLLSVLAREEEIDPYLERLRVVYETHPGYWTGRAYVSALRRIDRVELCLDICRQLIDEFTEDGALWQAFARCLWDTGDHEGALAAIDRAIELDPGVWRYFWRLKIQRDIEDRLATIVECYKQCNDADWVMARLRTSDGKRHPSEFAAAVAAADLEPPVRARLNVIASVVFENRSPAAATLFSHLEQIQALCDHFETPVLFMTYPIANAASPVHEDFVDRVEPRFLDLRRCFVDSGRPWNELKAPDGHCNDDGYALMAGFVAKALRSTE